MVPEGIPERVGKKEARNGLEGKQKRPGSLSGILEGGGEKKEAKVILASPVCNWTMITSGGSRQVRIQSSLDIQMR